MAVCKCRQPVPMQSQVSMYICASCSEKIVGPDPCDAEIARLKAEVASTRDAWSEKYNEQAALMDRLRAALAAGPAALREKGRTVRLMHPEFAAEWVEAAQEAALKGGG